MRASSSSIVNGRIEKEHASPSKGGSHKSLQLSVDDVPSEGRYLSIVGDDPDAMKPAGKVWVHWNVFNVPAAGKFALDAGQPPTGDVGVTSGGRRGYEGPSPPDGVHTYRFAVFATRDKVDIDTKVEWTIDAFEAKYGPMIVGKALVTGKF